MSDERARAQGPGRRGSISIHSRLRSRPEGVESTVDRVESVSSCADLAASVACLLPLSPAWPAEDSIDPSLPHPHTS